MTDDRVLSDREIDYRISIVDCDVTDETRMIR